MTVGAQQFQIREPIVLSIPIGVMKGHVEGLAAPLGQPALLAPVVLQPLVKKSSLEMGASGLCSSDNEQLANRHPGWPWFDRTPLHSGVPRTLSESKPLGALPHGHAAVIRSLDLTPVIPAPAIVTGWYSKPTGVIRDSGAGKPQSPPHLRLCQAFGKHFADQRSLP
jgi:hypothetical protein